MNTSQDWEGVEVSFEEARREIMKHRASVVEFLDTCGNKDEYDGYSDVLSYLGY